MSTSKKTFPIAAILGVACLQGACAVTAGDPTAERTGNAQSDLFATPSGLWPSGVMPVCWDPASPQASQAGYAAYQQHVRSMIANSWETVSAFKTTGWGTCPSNTTGYAKITVRAGRSRSGVGWNNGQGVGIGLDMTDGRDGTIVHEFGHAMGFIHEQERPDTPTWCTESAINDDGEVTTTGGVPLGPWDEYSIMDYCDPNFNSGALSAGDIAGVQALYGANWGAMVAPNGQCLDVPAFNTSPGTVPNTYPCKFQTNQEWRWSSLGTFGSGALVGLGDTCYAYNTSTPSIQACATGWGVFNQIWTMQNFEIRGPGNLCLDVAGGVDAPGTKVDFYRCNGQNNQKWTYNQSSELVTPGGNCLDVPASDASRGLQIWSCNGGNNQRWTIGDGGQVKSHLGLCLDLNLPAFDNEATQDVFPGSIYSCNGQINQKFAFHGPIYQGTPQPQNPATCLTLPGGIGAGTNTAPTLQTCGGRAVNGINIGDSTTQEWTYTPRVSAP